MERWCCLHWQQAFAAGPTPSQSEHRRSELGRVSFQTAGMTGFDTYGLPLSLELVVSRQRRRVALPHFAEIEKRKKLRYSFPDCSLLAAFLFSVAFGCETESSCEGLGLNFSGGLEPGLRGCCCGCCAHFEGV